VEGNGLSKIEDRNLALALLEKVNSFNDYIFFTSLIPVVVFATLPIEKVSCFAAFGVILSALSFVKEKFPVES